MSLTFEPVEHRYQWQGVTVPSVTQILGGLSDFSMVAPDMLEHARQRGVAVHRAVQLDIADDLDRASLAPEIEGYFSAWRSFREDMQLHEADFGEIERPLYHATYGYAGTPDMEVCMNKVWSVLDIKTAAELSPVWALQTAAYESLINANRTKRLHKIAARWSLRLRDNGTYRLDEFKDRGDWNVFLAALTLHNWKGKHA